MSFESEHRHVPVLLPCAIALALGITACSSLQQPTPLPVASLPSNYIAPSLRDVNIDGFKPAVAADLLEMCVDLDSQDDQVAFMKQNGSVDPRLSPHYPRVSRNWVKVYDSRAVVSDGDAAREADPRRNGFGPFDNAWTLWRKAANDNGQQTYALAIRGTVVGDRATIIEDLFATTIVARDGVRRENGVLPLSFSDLPRAEVHAGFAYATVSVLLDRDRGVISELSKLSRSGQLRSGTHLIITGHSQGAAMAALAQALLHYAQLHHQFEPVVDRLTVSSYMFAQPKPGNHQFAEDFALYATLRGSAFALNNSLDPVTRVPLTIEVPMDADADMQAHATLSNAVQHLNHFSAEMAAFASSRVNDRIERFVQDAGNDPLIDDPSARPVTPGAATTAVSLDYVAAGRVIPLIGHGDDASSDDFVEHHAITYRKLFEETFGVMQQKASGAPLHDTASLTLK